MGRRSDHSRAELEALILAAGEAQLAETGFARFSAREVAKRIGYSVGTLYHLFGSYDRLMLAINARTLRAWSAFLEERLQAADGDRIAALVFGYFDFAADNRNLWMALYDHRMAPDEPLSDEFVAAFGALAGIVEREVAAALGEAVKAEVRALAGSLVATAHGHCMFALNGTFALFGAWDPRQAALDRIRAALNERNAR
jgi:AcrR family transcriptional regulator